MTKELDLFEVMQGVLKERYGPLSTEHKKAASSLLQGDDFDDLVKAQGELQLAVQSKGTIKRAIEILKRASDELDCLGVDAVSVVEVYRYAQKRGLSIEIQTEPPVFHPQSPVEAKPVAVESAPRFAKFSEEEIEAHKAAEKQGPKGRQGQGRRSNHKNGLDADSQPSDAPSGEEEKKITLI